MQSRRLDRERKLKNATRYKTIPCNVRANFVYSFDNHITFHLRHKSDVSDVWGVIILALKNFSCFGKYAKQRLRTVIFFKQSQAHAVLIKILRKSKAVLESSAQSRLAFLVDCSDLQSRRQVYTVCINYVARTHMRKFFRTWTSTQFSTSATSKPRPAWTRTPNQKGGCLPRMGGDGTRRWCPPVRIPPHRRHLSMQKF